MNVDKALFLLFTLWWLLFSISSGCAPPKRYDYHAVKADYSDVKKASISNPAPAPPKSPGKLPDIWTIKGVIRFALANNPDMDMAIARIRQSEAMIDEALASFWPAFSVYGDYTQGDAPSTYFFKTIDQRRLTPGTDFNNPGWFENYEIGFKGKINIFNGGRDYLRKRMAETGLGISALDHESIENGLITSVIHAYFNVLAAENYIRIAQESVDTVEKQLGVLDAKYKAGGVLKSDLLSMKVRLAQARENLVRAENNHSLSLAALANLLGLDPDTTLNLAEGERMEGPFPSDYGEGLIQALAHRSDLQKVRLQIIQSQMALDVARSEYLPRLDARFNYYLDAPNLDFDADLANWTAGIILNWDVFTGFSTKSKVKKAHSVIEEMLAADRKTVQFIQLDLKTAFLKLEEAKASLAVSEASVAQAEESLRLVKKQYTGGSETITRYLEAEMARNRARIRATAAYYDREKSTANLGRALGYWGQYAKEVTTTHE
jgi:outer membrane protein TolC